MLRLSPPHAPLAPLPILYTNVWGQLLPITSRSCSLSPRTPNGEYSRSLLTYQSGSIWYGITAALAGPFPYTCHWRQATLLDLGCSEVVQRMIIAGFPSHANGPGQTSGNQHSSCYPLDRDNHSCPSRGYRCPLPSCPSVLHLPIFTRGGGLGGSRLQQWDRNVLVLIRMGNLPVKPWFYAPLLTGLWR